VTVVQLHRIPEAASLCLYCREAVRWTGRYAAYHDGCRGVVTLLTLGPVGPCRCLCRSLPMDSPPP
jgi:hypothetical protein